MVSRLDPGRLPWYFWLVALWVAVWVPWVFLAAFLDAFSGWIVVAPDLTTGESVENWRVTGRPLFRGECLYHW